MGLRGIVYLALAAFSAVFGGAWGKQIGEARASGGPEDPARDARCPTRGQTAIGFVTNFFDFLGIGSFATTTSAYRLLRLVPDRLIPGTLLVGHTFATLAEAFISIAIIKVEMPTLLLLVGSSMLGSWLGAGRVCRWPQREVQLGMGVALLAAAFVMLAGMLKLIPSGGEALGLSGTRLGIGMAGSF